MSKVLDLLEDTVGTGEVIKIRYNGGSQPGTVREIIPSEIDGYKDILYAYSLESSSLLSFRISKIEIANENDEVNFTFTENEIDFKVLDLLKDAIGVSKVVKIKYNGGSQPGSVREIIPRKIDDYKDILYAYCLVSGRIISFKISKIELADENDVVNYTYVERKIDLKDLRVKDFNELKEIYKDELERIGWFVKLGDKSIELSASGKERVMADIGISFEDDQKAWVIECRGKAKDFYHNENVAIRKFLSYCRKYSPSSMSSVALKAKVAELNEEKEPTVAAG